LTAVCVSSRDTVIGLIPARHGWEVSGVLSWQGAVNYDLDGAHHVAVLSSSQERYGAEPVTLTRDHIELLVAHPPRDPATMVQVAVEMLVYCPDLDVQGTGMVRCWPTRSSRTGAGRFGGTDPATRNQRASSPLTATGSGRFRNVL
jgi:hypothetical protein